ncbi:plexin-B2 isoform X2 [Rhinatrema bivittatum]|nr:plexin-B2 isoform X2 [Rhinatrema bivittatum]XP_029473246.1 plexin-B2 isoform X2 [Rhinatrema bivittatum]XP_029473248.1 plexin-B2 isoform X2 [Rhinatrema bivittatum]XP_029473249.1 plexin-B2 isoform X2 [Rhinatrema bivittatum]XP_029473250.1 plexin-B2 isoform X2 [Rhinatrema bivittatum]
MALWILSLRILIYSSLFWGSQAEKFTSISFDTELNHLTINNDTDTVYLGAVDALYQLTADLQLKFNVTTGPELDDKMCTPPIDSKQCPNSKPTHNYNKLLLLDKLNNRIVVCGSIFKGICALRELENITVKLFYEDSSGEKSFVASNDEKVATVGLVTTLPEQNSRALFVGKGNSQHDNGIIISTRLLDFQEGKDIFETYTDNSAFKYGSVSTSIQQFVKAFEDGGYVYFISSRLDKNTNKNRTLITRLCKKDLSYYSYIEMDLECKNEENAYNICQSVYIASPGEKLAQDLSNSGQYGSVAAHDKVLFAVFHKDNKDRGSAICMFSLQQINEKLEENRETCYSTQGNKLINGKKVFYKPYGTDITCEMKDKNTAKNYPCGSDHLPYPLESIDGVVGIPVLQRETNVFTAVAVAVEDEHAVAFLGTSDGVIVKVFLSSSPYEYDTIVLENNNPVKNELAFDAKQENLYAMIEKQLFRIPVQDCSHYSDCTQCLQAKDPYCGWCVVKGRCTRKVNCDRAAEENHWLWSPGGTCMAIVSASPESMSRKHTGSREVTLTVSPPITLTEDDQLKCEFLGRTVVARLEPLGSITCETPTEIPLTPRGKDHVFVEIRLTFNSTVFFASYRYPFYDCEEAMNLSENLPCISCVSSKYNCQWDWRNHKCEESSAKENVIKPNGEEDCPQFFEPDPSIVPMEHETNITFKGKNLQHYQEKPFTAFTVGNDEFEFKAHVQSKDEIFSFQSRKFYRDANETLPLNFYVKMDDKKIDSKLNVVLYNCLYGRSDCSLCLAADPKYQCVWCDSPSSRCVYKDQCRGDPATDCPDPLIMDIEPTTGPLLGGIHLTIKGSNLGIRAQDVTSISVGDIPCLFKEEFYSVSTRVVCEVGEAQEARSAPVSIEIKNKKGISPQNVRFTYQDPLPEAISPTEGPKAGGTSLTITGKNLITGSEREFRVELNGVPCIVTSFGEAIVCTTGRYEKTEDVQVKLCYGTNTEKSIGTFSYRENPTIKEFSPTKSFSSGGRNITISGTGFHLIQTFSMLLRLPASREKRQASSPEQQVIIGKDFEQINETTIIFSSPKLPENFNSHHQIITLLKMDGLEVVLKTNGQSFTYIPDPTFENFTDGIKKQVNSLIHAQGSNLNAAMTIQEAEASVGEEPCKINTLTNTDLYCVPPVVQPQPKRRHKRDTTNNLPEFIVKFGNREWVLGKVEYGQVTSMPLNIILPLVIIPMLAIIAISIYCYRRKSQQAEREYEKVKSQLEGLEESVRDRCKKEFTDLMIEMEDHTNDASEACIPFLDYKTYTDRVFFLPSKDGEKDVMITGKLDIPEARKQTVEQALNQFSNLLNSKSFLITFIRTLENQKDFNARAKVYFASLLTVALHGKLEYYTDIMRTLFLELMEQYVAKNPKLMLRRSETVVERMLSNWMSICLYQYLKDTASEPFYKLFKAIKHQVEKGPVDAVQIKAKYTLNDTGLLGDDVEYTQLTVSVIVQEEGLDSVPVKVLSCDTITQVKEKVIDQVYRNLPYSQRPKADTVALEWRPGSTAQILSDLDLTSQRDGRWKRYNTLMHYNVRDGATLILSKMGIRQQQEENHQEFAGERHALLEDENKIWHLARPADEVDEGKSKRGSMKEKERTKAITEIYLTRLLSVKGTLQQFVDNFFQSVLNSNQVVPPAVKYFFDFLDEQAEKHEIKDDDTIHIWKTNSLPLRFWVNILKNPHFIFDVHVHEVVDASLSVIAQTFMDACTRTEHKLSRDSPSNKLLYAKEISTYKKMVEDYYKGIRQMIQVSDQDMNTHLAEISRAHTESLNTLVALHQLYQYTNKYYDEIINALEEDPSAQRMQLAFRLQQIAAALENKVTDL